MNEVQTTAKTKVKPKPKVQGLTARVVKSPLAHAISTELKRAARKSRIPATIVSGGGGLRARRSDRILLIGVLVSFIVILALPAVFASVYYGLIASNQYVTEVRFALRDSQPASLDSVAGLAGLSTAQIVQDSLIVTNYIGSRAIVETIDKDLDLRRIYSRSDVDALSRFNPKKPIEDLVEYWRSRVDASIEAMSGIITVSVRAFTADDSLAVANKIVTLSEKLVNDLSERARNDALAGARRELERTEDKLRQATAAMRDVRNEERLLDGTAAATAVDQIVTQLRKDLASLEQQIAVQRTSLSPDSPQMRIQLARAATLRQQIANFSAEIAGTKGNGAATIATRMGKLSRQQIELDIAQQQYTAAASSYEAARVDAQAQHNYLLSFLKATLPEKPLYPRRWLGWAIIVVPALLIWAILTAGAFLVRDHMAK